jgi:hypothetical protein
MPNVYTITVPELTAEQMNEVLSLIFRNAGPDICGRVMIEAVSE